MVNAKCRRSTTRALSIELSGYLRGDCRGLCVEYVFARGPKQFRAAPGLGHASAWRMGAVAVEYLREVPKTCFFPMLSEILKPACRPGPCRLGGCRVGLVHLEVSRNE